MKGFPVFIICILGFLPAILLAQEEASCDCAGRIRLNDTIYSRETSPVGPGKLMEISSEAMPEERILFEREHHTAWLEFKAPGNCLIELTITPRSQADDYDFVLFPFFDASSCDSIRQGLLRPLRSVISRNDPSIRSVTGLRDEAGPEYVPFGPGQPFAASIRLKEGAGYLLVIDNVYPGGSGFDLHIKYIDCRETPAPPPQVLTRFKVNVTDSSGNPLGAGIIVRQKYSSSPGPDTLLNVHGSSAAVDLPPSTYYMVQVRRNGYIAWTEDIRSRDRFDSLVMDVVLDSIRIGKTFLFDKIYFRPGTAQFLPGTKDALKQIHKLMHENPSIRVEIQGHINQPYNLISRLSAGESQGLSELRARAVYDYLIKRGIPAYRMVVKGYGNSRMIYPYARNEEEMEKNRRVEIVILEVLEE